MGNVTTRVKDKLSQCSGRCPTGSSGERGNDPWSDPSKGMVGNPYKQTPTSSPFLGSAAPVRGESVEYEDEAEPPHASPQPVAAEEPAAPHVENTALASLMHSRLAHAGGEAPEVDRSEEKPTRSRRHTPKKIANPPSRRTMSVDRSVMLRKTMPPPENSAGSCFSCGGVKEPPPDVRERLWRNFHPDDEPTGEDGTGKSRLDRKKERQKKATELSAREKAFAEADV